MNPLTTTITLVLAIMVWVVPRRYLLVPFLVATCFIPYDQRLIVFGLDFNVLRILVVMGILRLLLKSELRTINWNIFDKLVVVWVFVGAVIYVAQWLDMQSIIYKSGTLFDLCGLYFIFRQSLRGWPDIKLVIKTLAICILILLPFIIYELLTRSNPFEILGRVTNLTREGRYRCNASFYNPMLFGLFWVGVLPYFMALALTSRQKLLYWAATSTVIFAVIATASSTPLASMVVVIILLPLFRYRQNGKQTLWLLFGLAVVLHFVMNGPIWGLLARIDLVAGSTGWYRYLLVDYAIKNFGQWALLGVKSTESWIVPSYRALTDVCNQYVLEGVRGGIATLLLFVFVLCKSVKITWQSSMSISTQQNWLAWSTCVAILGHCTAFWAMAYSGQIIMLLYLTFAIVGTIQEMQDSKVGIQHRLIYTNKSSEMSQVQPNI